MNFYIKLVFIFALSLNNSLGAGLRLTETDRVSFGSLLSLVQDLAWVSTGSQDFMAVIGDITGLDSRRLRLFELDSDLKLNQVYVEPNIDTLSLGPYALSWYSKGSDHWLAVGGSLTDSLISGFENVRLFKLDIDMLGNASLSERYRVPTSLLDGTVETMDWIEVEGVPFLAVGGTFLLGPPVQLYKMESDGMGSEQLTQVFSIPTSILAGTARSVSWQMINDVPYLAVAGEFVGGGGIEALRLYRLEFDSYGNYQLIQEAVLPTSILNGVINDLSWLEVNNEFFLAVGLNATLLGPAGVRIFRVDTEYGNISFTQVADTPAFLLQGSVATLEWKQFGNTNVLAVAGFVLGLSGQQDLNVYTFDHETFNVTLAYSEKSFNLANNIFTLGWHTVGSNEHNRSSSPTVLAVGGEFIDLGPNNEDLYLFSLDFINDLGLQKEVVNDTTVSGGMNTFKIAVTNTGQFEACNVSIFDILPSGVTFVSSIATSGSYDSSTGYWIIDTIPSEKTEYLYITVKADSMLANGTVIINSARILDPYNLDPYDNNNVDNASFQIVSKCNRDFSITKTVNKTEAMRGEAVTFTITVQA